MDTQTPPPGQYTPQAVVARRRIAAPSSVSRLSASFSLNPADTSVTLSDVSLMSPTKGRAAFLSSAEQGHMGMGQVSPRMRSPFTRSLNGGPSRSSLPGSEPRLVTRSRSRLGEAPDVDYEDTQVDEDEDEEESLIAQMRIWRHDAIVQHLHETAIFWGDKLLTLTGESNDAFWLAQAYFLTGNYVRAEQLLIEPLPLKGRGKGKGKGRAGDKDGDGDDEIVAVRPLATQLACRYLLAQCLMAQERYEEALDVVGTSNPFRDSNDGNTPSGDGGVKVHSSICHVRGVLHLRLSAIELAKEALMEALILDVKNYEAFRELVDGKLMTAAEEWEFMNNLAYRQQLSPEAATFVKLMYVSKLRKDDHVAEMAAARRQLVETYEEMADNCDVLVARADELFTRAKWEDCYVLTSKILKRQPGHSAALPLHLACMYHIPRLQSSLFLFAHDLVEQEPHQAMAWYAVGLWYLTGKKWGEARRYFSKACLIDQRASPAWIAFAHSHSWEGEHDQAIAAYSTAQRQFPGSHLTYLFIGQEYLQVSQMDLAEEHFLAAAQLNSSDPLVLNELGVAAHNREDHAAAIDYFQRAIAVAGTTQGSQATWSSTHCNLGHSLRLLRRFPEARAAYAQAIHLDPLNHTAVAAQAMLSHLEGDIRSAIRLYHNALSLAPQDPVPNVLLEMALNEQCDALDPTTLPGLPPAIARADLDPFAVPKGNSAFGPLPVEADPQTLEEAGDHSRDMTFEPDMSFSQNFQEHEYSRSIAFAPTPHAHGNAHLGVGAGVRAGASGSRSPRTPGYEASYNESSMMEIEDD